MPAKPSPPAVTALQVEGRIHVARGQRVMLDADLAELYGVETRAINQAVQRNQDRFPGDFAFRLTTQEVANLKSQSVISSSAGYGGRRTAPWAFTEHGVAMLASVLRSPTAARVSVEIIRVFVRLRRLLATPGELVAQVQQLAETVKLHDEHIRAISDVLRKMMTPPPEPAKRRIGFRPPEPPPTSPEGKS